MCKPIEGAGGLTDFLTNNLFIKFSLLINSKINFKIQILRLMEDLGGFLLWQITHMMLL